MKSPEEHEVQMIPVEKIRVINPRERDRKKYAQIVESIAAVGLKKPIKVSRRRESDEDGYDLVFGQGRLEAFMVLGAKEIPAIVVDIAKEDRLLMSLVENMARKHPGPAALLREIQRLKKLGHTNLAIGKKIGISDVFVGGLLALAKAGEERLLEAALNGKLPITVAIDIAKTEGIDEQRELLKAFESKQLNYMSLRVVKRLIEQRRIFGKSRGTGPRDKTQKRPSADSLVLAYRKEADRQKAIIQKAGIAENRLLFIVTALQKLLSNENFINLLRAENLGTMPDYLADRINKNSNHEHAAA